MICKGLEDLDNTINQLDQTDINRKIHITAAEYTFFLSAHKKLFRIDNILGHKTNLNKFKRTEVI